MAAIVMLTGLVGENIDITAGDTVHCCDATARRFLAVGYARPFDSETDDGRPIKTLPNSTGDKPQPEPEPPAGGPSKPRKRKPKDGQAQ